MLAATREFVQKEISPNVQELEKQLHSSGNNYKKSWTTRPAGLNIPEEYGDLAWVLIYPCLYVEK